VADHRRRYPSRDLATEDSGNGPTEADPSRRVSSSSKRATTARRRAIVGGIAALAIAGGAVFLFSGGGDGPGGVLGGIIPGDDGPETPDFTFEVKKVVPETTTETPSKQLKKEAEGVADEVKTTLDELYFDGYVESETWGDFGEIEELFEETARDKAETDLDTLTLGASGSETFAFVQPDDGTLVIDVLTDEGDRPVQALAFVKFRGTAEGEDGTYTEVRSTGSFFLRHADGGWKIYSYRVERADRPTHPPEGSGTPSASATASVEGEG
jgi:hypothetical protein